MQSSSLWRQLLHMDATKTRQPRQANDRVKPKLESEL